MSSTPTESDRDIDPEALVSFVLDRERYGRDLGADEFLEKVRRSRGEFRFRAENRTLLRHIAPRAGQVVLDAGAGVGRHAFSVAPRVAQLVCTDIAPHALEVLAREARRRGLSKLTTVECDLLGIPESLGPFDTIYCSEVLQHVPTSEQHIAILRRFHALLKSGGRCVIAVVCWNRRAGGEKVGFRGAENSRTFWHFFTLEELRALFMEAGFHDVSMHPMTLLPGTLTRRLPGALAPLESMASRLRGLAGSGRLLVGVGTR